MLIGVLGGGQLGRMLALAGYPLGLRFRFLDSSPEAPAGQLAELIVGDFADERVLERFVRGVDVVTYEFENVPAAAARWLGEHVPVWPPPAALEIAQDRVSEKDLFSRLGVPTPAFAPVSSAAELEAAIGRVGLPAVLKTRRGGYDGKGQFIIRRADESAAAWGALGGAGAGLVLESFVPFEREVSIIAVGGRDGAARFYPLVENLHEGGILRRSRAPAPGAAGLQAQAERHARRVLEDLSYVGVLTIEFFVREGRLLANEMAPRVHNSGHWTIEGAETSQFENHLRALAGWPLGPTAARGAVAMVNLIGRIPDAAPLLELASVHLHLYGKPPRPGRKVGHVTIVAPDESALAQRMRAAEARLREPADGAPAGRGHAGQVPGPGV